MAIYAIGDIHGSINALKTIFQHGLIKEDDKVVFLGDYVDKGADSKGVIDWLIEKSKTFDFKFILGNHEIMMTRAKSSTEIFEYWLEDYGGSLTLNSYKIGDNQNWMNQIDKSHWNFINSCLPYLEIGEFIFVHAGLEENKRLEEQNEHDLFFKKFEAPLIYDPIKTVICGHTARKNGKIANFKHTICIDTYAHGGMWLTCLNVETGEFLKANNKGQIEKGKLKRMHFVP
ncbi:serine/threonine protein phosphatase [Bizionia gelidisalsuginis]|uniref:Serine/threonine protein phosphatase n=2 Tax=Bizionia TaxID=283785 RepID=A0A8H2LHA5_9FLAO|nr:MULTISPECIES: metallophosphoesterase family protein [Bizionia]TYB74495.1 serine/threonine protein phosphatase [Bizionia saleffrena]TYC16291.1 serine/threonine protein phosphatase [Bizionia gelidisalsuginis]